MSVTVTPCTQGAGIVSYTLRWGRSFLQPLPAAASRDEVLPHTFEVAADAPQAPLTMVLPAGLEVPRGATHLLG